jgi:hypothetical protein
MGLLRCVQCGQIRTTESIYHTIAIEAAQTTDEKNKAYGDSYAKSGKILEILYPDGASPDQYTDMLGIVRCIDKFFRIATSKDAFGENPWLDIVGYGLLGASKK